MKKYIIWAIIFASIFAYWQISSVWDTQITKWKYIIQKWDTISLIPKRFSININSTTYKLWLKLNGISINLKAWTYSFDSNLTLKELLSKWLNSPDSLDQEITILPGRNIYDIDDYLSNKWVIKEWELIALSENIPDDIMSKYSFLTNANYLEWFLYPDTYRVALEAKIEDIISIQLDEFQTKIMSKYNLNWDKLYKNMIMASIVQKEEKDTTNQPIVAWILLKRLNQKIAIWADATVCYQYKIISKECTPSFIGEKIYIKSAYNTRSQLGLPPTPISNFTNNTFDSVVNPDTSDYYYYLHDNEWGIHYAKTLNEHVRNKNLYIK